MRKTGLRSITIKTCYFAIFSQRSLDDFALGRLDRSLLTCWSSRPKVEFELVCLSKRYCELCRVYTKACDGAYIASCSVHFYRKSELMFNSVSKG